jgi:hypothetical protein
MNTPDPLNPGGSPLFIPQREGKPVAKPAAPSAAQAELAADLEALRERETNLREYEERLRSWQAQLDARVGPGGAAPGSGTPFIQGVSQMPFSSDSLLASSWEKFHRARAILESEQKQMRDERMMMREAEVSMKRRELALADREERLAAREKKVVAPEPKEKKPPTAMERLTKGPFFGTRSGLKPDK